MSVTNPKGEEKFIAAAFPSACGKTNMAMMNPALPGWKIQCIGKRNILLPLMNRYRAYKLRNVILSMYFNFQQASFS